ncbi:MAG: hypothetical protein HY556_01400 [Euryarchaeota archaeon]|nr:hypothetical protein [Euryarchaeota archaeon]
MRDEAILETLRELEKWRERQAAIERELAGIRSQVAYYERLVSEMKRETKPARVTDLLDSIARL